MAFIKIETDTKKIAPDGIDSIHYRKSWYRDSDDEEYMDLILYSYKENLFRFDLIYGLDMLQVTEDESTYFKLYPADDVASGYVKPLINTVGGAFPLGKFVDKFKKASKGMNPRWQGFLLASLTDYNGMIDVEPAGKEDR